MLVSRSAQPIMTVAAGLGSTIGFSRGSYGKLTRDPVSLQGEGSSVVGLWDQNTNGDIRFTVSGDQRTFGAGKTLTIGAASYDVDSALEEVFSGGNTIWRWTGGTAFSLGALYDVEFS